MSEHAAPACTHRAARFGDDTRGAIFLTVAIALPVLLGATALAVDLGMWYRERTTLQLAADAAAMGAARLLSDASATTGNYQTVALAEAEGAIGHGTVGALVTPISVSVTAGQSVTVTLTSAATQYFTAALGVPAPTLTATAEAGLAQPPACVLALDQASVTGISITGNATVDAPQCGIFSNATSAHSLDFTGNISVDAKSIGSSGIARETGNVSVTPTPLNNQGAVADPLSSLTPPTPAACTSASGSYTGNQTVTLWPGTYCSGLSFAGNTTVTFEPGTYILEGNFSLAGNVTIASATGVTFYLGGSSPGTLQWTGKIMTQSPMTAPTSGPYAGVLVYQDRSASAGNVASFTGNASLSIGGTLYLPEAKLSITGNAFGAPPAASGFSVIADTIAITGNPTFSTGTSTSGGASSEVTLLR